jgi:ubiquitin carboxyl-terminal hydrolase 2/21
MNKWKEYFKSCYSKIVELFYGQMITCIDINGVVKSRSYNPICFFTLPIPVDKFANIDIYNCFNLFTDNEVLDGDNKWFCDKDNTYYTANKKTLFWKFPTIIIISFKRFNNLGEKINDNITFPLNNLNLSDYCMGYEKYKSNFNLYGICNHIGSSSGGHYYSYCKNQNGKWYEYNDNRVNEISENNIVTKNAYCLFYTKINNTLIK